MKTINRKIILIDMDGVLCQYDKALILRMRERFGDTIINPNADPKQYPESDTHLMFLPEYHEMAKSVALEAGFFQDLEPFPGAIAALLEMKKTQPWNYLFALVPRNSLIIVWVKNINGSELTWASTLLKE